VRWVSVVARADGLGWIGEGRVEEATVQDLEEQDEDRDTDCGLGVLGDGLNVRVGYLRQWPG
jgi:hypothetical protein